MRVRADTATLYIELNDAGDTIAKFTPNCA
jgi:hypothetical protein